MVHLLKTEEILFCFVYKIFNWFFILEKVYIDGLFLRKEKRRRKKLLLKRKVKIRGDVSGVWSAGGSVRFWTFWHTTPIKFQLYSNVFGTCPQLWKWNQANHLYLFWCTLWYVNFNNSMVQNRFSLGGLTIECSHKILSSFQIRTSLRAGKGRENNNQNIFPNPLCTERQHLVSSKYRNRPPIIDHVA